MLLKMADDIFRLSHDEMDRCIARILHVQAIILASRLPQPVKDRLSGRLDTFTSRDAIKATLERRCGAAGNRLVKANLAPLTDAIKAAVAAFESEAAAALAKPDGLDLEAAAEAAVAARDRRRQAREADRERRKALRAAAGRKTDGGPVGGLDQPAA